MLIDFRNFQGCRPSRRCPVAPFSGSLTAIPIRLRYNVSSLSPTTTVPVAFCRRHDRSHLPKSVFGEGLRCCGDRSRQWNRIYDKQGEFPHLNVNLPPPSRFRAASEISQGLVANGAKVYLADRNAVDAQVEELKELGKQTGGSAFG
jgi:hypothetical protein